MDAARPPHGHPGLEGVARRDPRLYARPDCRLLEESGRQGRLLGPRPGSTATSAEHFPL